MSNIKEKLERLLAYGAKIKNESQRNEAISVSDYLKSLKDNGTLTDMEGAEYLVQSFNDGKLEVIAGYKDIEKAAKRFLNICGKYDKVVFKQLFDNGKDIKVLDSNHKESDEIPKHLSYVNESLSGSKINEGVHGVKVLKATKEDIELVVEFDNGKEDTDYYVECYLVGENEDVFSIHVYDGVHSNVNPYNANEVMHGLFDSDGGSFAGMEVEIGEDDYNFDHMGEIEDLILDVLFNKRNGIVTRFDYSKNEKINEISDETVYRAAAKSHDRVMKSRATNDPEFDKKLDKYNRLMNKGLRREWKKAGLKDPRGMSAKQLGKVWDKDYTPVADKFHKNVRDNLKLGAFGDQKNEGAGAAVTIYFDHDPRHHYRINANINTVVGENKITCENILIADYYYSAHAYDGGYIVFEEDTMKEAFVNDYNEYSRNIDDPEITVNDIENIYLGGYEEITPIVFGGGWVRSKCEYGTVLDWSDETYLPRIEIIATINGEEESTITECNGKYYPSSEACEVISDPEMAAKDEFGDDEDEYEESLNEKTVTSKDIKNFLKEHGAKEVNFGSFGEIKRSGKVDELVAYGSKKVAGTYDETILYIYKEGARLVEKPAKAYGKFTEKFFKFSKPIEEKINEEYKERLNESSDSHWDQHTGGIPLAGKYIKAVFDAEKFEAYANVEAIIFENLGSKHEEYPYGFEVALTTSSYGVEARDEGYAKDLKSAISECLGALKALDDKFELSIFNDYRPIEPSQEDINFLASSGKISEDDSGYLNDDEIASFYKDFEIVSIDNLEKKSTIWNGEEQFYYTGDIVIKFPNADADYDEFAWEETHDDFIAHKEDGTKVAFDKWYPDFVYNKLSSEVTKAIQAKFPPEVKDVEGIMRIGSKGDIMYRNNKTGEYYIARNGKDKPAYNMTFRSEEELLTWAEKVGLMESKTNEEYGEYHVSEDDEFEEKLDEVSDELADKVKAQRQKDYSKAYRKFKKVAKETTNINDPEQLAKWNKATLDYGKSYEKKERNKLLNKARKTNEEYGEYQDDPNLKQIANQLEYGNTHGMCYGGAEWGEVEINGTPISDLLKTSEVIDWVLQELSYPVRDGHAYYNGLNLLFNNYSYEDQIDHTDENIIADLVALGFDEDEIKEMPVIKDPNYDGNISDERFKEIQTWVDFDILYKPVEDDEEDDDYDENLNEVSSKTLKAELEEGIKKFFKYEPDALDWAFVEISKEEGRTRVEVRAELDYSGMWALSDALDPVVKKYDKEAYFDQEQPGIMVAFIENKKGLGEKKTCVDRAKLEALITKKKARFQESVQKNESKINESVSNWEQHEGGLVQADKYIRLVTSVDIEGADLDLVALIFQNKKDAEFKFGYELSVDSGADTTLLSEGSSDYLSEIIDLCLAAIKEFDEKNNTNIIYDVKPLEPSKSDMAFLQESINEAIPPINQRKRIEFEDDIVRVYDGNKEIYAGAEDYEPMQDENWKWDNTNKYYKFGKYIKVCCESVQKNESKINETIQDKGKPISTSWSNADSTSSSYVFENIKGKLNGPETINLKDKAAKIGNDKKLLLKRLKDGLSVLKNEYKKEFKDYEYDFENKALHSKTADLSLVWKNNGRTSEGSVALYKKSKINEASEIAEEIQGNNLDSKWVIRAWMDNTDSKDGYDEFEFTKIGLIDFINSEEEEYYGDSYDYQTEPVSYDISDEELKTAINDNVFAWVFGDTASVVSIDGKPINETNLSDMGQPPLTVMGVNKVKKQDKTGKKEKAMEENKVNENLDKLSSILKDRATEKGWLNLSKEEIEKEIKKLQKKGWYDNYTLDMTLLYHLKDVGNTFGEAKVNEISDKTKGRALSKRIAQARQANKKFIQKYPDAPVAISKDDPRAQDWLKDSADSMNKTMKARKMYGKVVKEKNEQYIVHQMVGNYSTVAGTFDLFDEAQDFLMDEWTKYATENNISLDDEAEQQNFFSYYSIEDTKAQEALIKTDYSVPGLMEDYQGTIEVFEKDGKFYGKSSEGTLTEGYANAQAAFDSITDTLHEIHEGNIEWDTSLDKARIELSE